MSGRALEPAVARGDRATGIAVPVAVVGAALALGRFGPANGWVPAFFVAVLVVLSAIDLERRVLPNRIVLPAAAIVLTAQTAHAPERAFEWFGASVGAALFLYLPLLIHPAGMGMGDVKLALLLGAGLGAAVVPALLLGFLLAVPVALYLLLRHGPAARKRTIPFGPFLALGALVVLFAGAP